MEIDQHLKQESTIGEKFEVPKKKGDGLPPPELKPLPKEIRYEILDEHNTAGSGYYRRALRGRDDPMVVVLCIRRHERRLIPGGGSVGWRLASAYTTSVPGCAFGSLPLCTYYADE